MFQKLAQLISLNLIKFEMMVCYQLLQFPHRPLRRTLQRSESCSAKLDSVQIIPKPLKLIYLRGLICIKYFAAFFFSFLPNRHTIFQ